MLDIKFVRENKEIVEMAIKNKKVKQSIDLDRLFELSDTRSELRTQIDEVNQKRNQAAKEQNVEEGKALKEQGSALEERFAVVDKEYIEIMLLLPNIPSADTPIGEDESANVAIRQIGDKPKFDFEPKEHWELAEELDIIDKENAAAVSGARFAYLKGDLALLQFALINFANSLITDQEKLQAIIKKYDLNVSDKPFTMMMVPTIVKSAVLNRMARLEPKEDRYHIEEDDLYLVGSAEHSLGPIHMDQTIPNDQLPIRYLGYSTSYRREAGTYGKDMKGILRLHQFDKLEMETFCTPETSRDEQDLMTSIQEELMFQLGLPYQVMMISTGDMGIPDHRQVDIETWMPGQDKYRETHTTDLMTSYQSRRLNTRYKNAEGKSEYVHMIDGTLSAIGRCLIAIMENYQQADGTIKIPEVLIPYMNGKTAIEK